MQGNFRVTLKDINSSYYGCGSIFIGREFEGVKLDCNFLILFLLRESILLEQNYESHLTKHSATTVVIPEARRSSPRHEVLLKLFLLGQKNVFVLFVLMLMPTSQF